MNTGPPIFDFDRLKPVTMTIIASFDVKELNLPAIFSFLPVTEQCLPPHSNFQRKQGKIRLPPELNIPGEILSMRYDGNVRGIVRSENARSFPHSIIIDIGTSERIISVKLAPTIELTGPTSYAIAREATEALLGQVKRCQKGIEFIRNNIKLARKLKDRFIQEKYGSPNKTSQDNVNNNIVPSSSLSKNRDEERILTFFWQHTRGYSEDRVEEFLDFMINFNRNLYIGTLKLTGLTSDMTNIHFNLGYPINQAALAQIMNSEPFECPYNNIKTCSSVNVHYRYIKHDRNTGQPKPAHHTIQVNKSGHVKYSGPSPEAMKPVYYAFMRKIIENYDKIKSAERSRRQLRIRGKSKAISLVEFSRILDRENQLRSDVIKGNVPMPSNSRSEEHDTQEENIEKTKVISKYENSPDQPQASVLDFDYTPISIH